MKRPSGLGWKLWRLGNKLSTIQALQKTPRSRPLVDPCLALVQFRSSGLVLGSECDLEDETARGLNGNAEYTTA